MGHHRSGVAVPVRVFAVPSARDDLSTDGTADRASCSPACYKQGNVNFEVVLLICIDFLLGDSFGAKLMTGLSNVALERIFGIAMLAIGVKMLMAR